jgi:hypothetical protein
MNFKRANKFFVIGSIEEGKTERTRIVVETGQMLEDFLAQDFPALVGNVEYHAFWAVSVTFGMPYDAFVFFKRYQSIVNSRCADFRPTIELTVTDFRDDVISAALMLQYESKQYQIVTVHLNSLIVIIPSWNIKSVENYIIF